MQSYFARLFVAAALFLVPLAALAQPYTAPPAAASGGYVPTLNADGGAPSHVTNFPSTQTVAGSVGLSGTLPAFASPPTVNLGTAPSLMIGNFPATQPISAASLPLPAGAATAANQPALSITYTASTSASAGTTSGTLFAAAAYAHVVTFCTLPTSTANVWLNLLGSTAVANQGTPIYGGGGCTTLGTQLLPMPTSAVTAITDGVAAQSLAVSGG